MDNKKRPPFKYTDDIRPIEERSKNSFEVRNAEAENLLRKIGLKLGIEMPPGYGFFLAIFTFGKGGDLFYASNAIREDVINMMEEFKQEFLKGKKDG